MVDQPKQVGGGRKMFGDFAPKLAELTDDVLFADVWNRPQLSARDRSLITVSVLTAAGNTEQLGFRLGRALENGVTNEELIEAITRHDQLATAVWSTHHPSQRTRGHPERIPIAAWLSAQYGAAQQLQSM